MASTRLRRVSTVLLWACVAFAVARFASYAGRILHSPWSRDYGEGCVLAMGQLLLERGTYFFDLESYPYLVANYPPVFIAGVALGQRLFGPTLRFPRLLSVLSTLVLLGVLYALTRRLGLRRDHAAALSALALAPWFATTWAALARVDMLALTLSLAGLAAVARHGLTSRSWPALPLFWLAFFTKQTTLLAPAAVVIDRLLARDRRLPPALAAWGLPVALLLGWLVLATHGEAWRHLIPYTAAADYEWDRMVGSYLQLAAIGSPLLVLVTLALLAARPRLLAGPGRLLMIYLALKLAGFATIAKQGAAQNYFLEPWIALLPAAALALVALGERFPRWRDWIPAALAAAAAVAAFSYPSLQRLPRGLARPERATEYVELNRLVRNARGPILSENLSLLVVNDQAVLVEPFGVLLLAKHGLLSTDAIVRDCESQAFALVVTEERLREIPGISGCLDSRYELLGDFGPYQALRPRGVVPPPG